MDENKNETQSPAPQPTSEKPKKHYILIGIGVIAILIVVYLLFTQMNGSENNALPSQNVPSQTPSPSANNSDSTQKVVYTGTSPCADCSGINVTLTLNYDGQDNVSGTYTEQMVYQGKNTEPFTETGTWKGLDDDVIELTPSGSNSQPQYYKQTSVTTLEALGANQEELPPPANYTLTAN